MSANDLRTCEILGSSDPLWHEAATVYFDHLGLPQDDPRRTLKKLTFDEANKYALGIKQVKDELLSQRSREGEVTIRVHRSQRAAVAKVVPPLIDQGMEVIWDIFD